MPFELADGQERETIFRLGAARNGDDVRHVVQRFRGSATARGALEVASDVYALSPHTGRGGWTWYSGSAGWMNRLIMESILGLRLEADKLHVEPCIPSHWASFKMNYRYREMVYHITVWQTRAADGVTMLTVDGIERRYTWSICAFTLHNYNEAESCRKNEF